MTTGVPVATHEASPITHLPRAEDFLLWPPALQVQGYRIVDRLFAHRVVRCAPAPRPLAYGATLDVATPIDGDTIDVATFMDRNRIAGLLVLHEGKVRIERYGLGLLPSDRWSTMSTVKSMTAVLAGAAVRDGAIRLDDPVTRHLPELAGSAYDRVRLRDLLTMSSGVAWDENYEDKASDVNRYSKSLADKVPGGVLAMMRALPPAHPPGTCWHYNSGDTYLLGAALTRATGMPLADYLSQRIWQPCGMAFDAFYTLESDGGQEIGGSRAGMTLGDIGRFAGFVLDDGVVDGRRLLPEGWIDACGRIAFRFDADVRAAFPRIPAGGLVGYGYSWWIDGEGAMIANGFAGQRIYVDRAARLAIVTLAAFPQPPWRGPGEHDQLVEVVRFTQAVRRALGVAG